MKTTLSCINLNMHNQQGDVDVIIFILLLSLSIMVMSIAHPAATGFHIPKNQPVPVVQASIDALSAAVSEICGARLGTWFSEDLMDITWEMWNWIHKGKKQWGLEWNKAKTYLSLGLSDNCTARNGHLNSGEHSWKHVNVASSCIMLSYVTRFYNILFNPYFSGITFYL